MQASAGQLKGVLMLVHDSSHVSVQPCFSRSASCANIHSAGVSYSDGHGSKLAMLCAEMAMMKSYALASTNPDGKGAANRFVAYMVPKDVPQETPAHPSNRHVHLLHLLCSLLPTSFKATLRWLRWGQCKQFSILAKVFLLCQRTRVCVEHQGL